MPNRSRVPATKAEALSFWLLVVFLVILWIAGGASRPDVPGQVLTRTAAWLLALVGIALLPLPRSADLRTPAMLLAATIVLAALQLIPLPPAVWGALPGRGILVPGETAAGLGDVWRPMALSPGWTRNALGSLIVPVVCLGLIATVPRSRDTALLRVLVSMIVAGCLLALLEFIGRPIDHPLVNDVSGQISGNFANRNHLALFAASGCVLAPIWATRERAFGNWGWLLASALVAMFLVVILATGSRAGIALGIIGTAAGVMAPLAQLRRSLAALPRKVALPAVATVLGAVGAALAASFLLGRAAGIERAMALSAQGDARLQALPTVIEMMRTYFPVGAGFGTFDPAFRIHEGDALLGTTYFNQAHNDLLQVVLEGGLAGLALLILALAWWAARSVSVWLRSSDPMQRAGSAILFLVIVGSAFDYPARTPMVMALIVVAIAWLARKGPQPDADGRRNK